MGRETANRDLTDGLPLLNCCLAPRVSGRISGQKGIAMADLTPGTSSETSFPKNQIKSLASGKRPPERPLAGGKSRV